MMSVFDYERMLDLADDSRPAHDPDEFFDPEGIAYELKHRPLGTRELTAELIGCEIRDSKL